MTQNNQPEDTRHELKRLNFAGGSWVIAKRVGGGVMSHFGLGFNESYATLRWETVKVGEPAKLWVDHGHRGKPREVTTSTLLLEEIL